MRRQFLRVYLGIAAVLLTAAFVLLFIVNQETRKVVESRIEETMEPMVWRMRQRLLRFADTPEQRAEVLARLNEEAWFAVRLVPWSGEDLSAWTREKLEMGRPALERVRGERFLYAPFDEDELLVLGPLQDGPPPGRRRLWPRRGPLPPLPPEEELSLLRRLPFHGTYLLLGVLLAILLVIGGSVYLLLRPFERRIYALGDVARNFGEGKFASRAADTGEDAIGALGRTFNQMADRIAGFIERQRELLHAVSHELRTPLARLFFLVDDAQEAAAPDEKAQYLRRIEDSLKDLNDLVDELLAFVRLEGQADQQARETVAIDAVLPDLAALLADLRPELEVALDGGELQVTAIPRLFRRAVFNLATNAARHARQRLALTAVRQEEIVHLHVDDDGPGVPPEFREKVFEPFFRLDESRTADTGGVGLGLAIVQRIARLHDGQVRVDDSPLGGARFTLSLPAAPSS